MCLCVCLCVCLCECLCVCVSMCTCVLACLYVVFCVLAICTIIHANDQFSISHSTVQSCILTVWRPTDDIMSLLQEGVSLKLYHVMASSPHRYSSDRIQVISCVTMACVNNNCCYNSLLLTGAHVLSGCQKLMKIYCSYSTSKGRSFYS